MSHTPSPQQLLLSQDCPNEMLVESLVIKETDNPKLRYRRELEEIVQTKHGEISALDIKILETLRIRLGLSPAEAFDIKNEVLSPYRDYNKRLQEYRRTFFEASRREHLLLRSETRNGLKRLQELLNLKDEDVKAIEAQIIQKRKGSDGNNVLVVVSIVAAILLAGVSSWVIVSFLSPVRQEQTSQNPANSQEMGDVEQNTHSVQKSGRNNSQI